jgi:hypothetical protein
MTTKPTQLFGTVDSPTGQASAMICIDSDRPHEYMIYSWGYDNPVALLFDAEMDSAGSSISLKARNLYRPLENGSLYLPRLDDVEARSLRAISAKLNWVDGGVKGQLKWLDAKDYSVEFNPEPSDPVINANECKTWGDFKQWATESRSRLDTAIYRGHGNRNFHLQTSLHRAGRCRIERYCSETLQQFHLQAEAALNLRLDMNDGGDYAVVLGLGQHHGLPTPLLDWTESPYIAAFFAFADALESAAFRSEATHVRIFGLTRKFLNKESPPNVILPYFKPYACALEIAPRHNQRLQVQQGRFLVTNVVDLERYFCKLEDKTSDKLLHAIDIPISVASEALEDLAFMGVTAASMFPGLDGICRKLRHQMTFIGKPISEAGKPAGESVPIADSSISSGSSKIATT